MQYLHNRNNYVIMRKRRRHWKDRFVSSVLHAPTHKPTHTHTHVYPHTYTYAHILTHVHACDNALVLSFKPSSILSCSNTTLSQKHFYCLLQITFYLTHAHNISIMHTHTHHSLSYLTPVFLTLVLLPFFFLFVVLACK